MSDLNFYEYFRQQTVQAYGDLTDDYPTVPTPPVSQTVEDIMKESQAVKIANDNPAMIPFSANVSKPVTVSLTDEMTQQGELLSAPTGPVPPGYASASCCQNCLYFCGVCIKFDFPCHPSYICDHFESLHCCDQEKGEVFSEGALLLDLMTLSDNEVEILAAGWTDKGNVKSDVRKKKAVLSEGRFPVFDKKSALSALKLRGKAKNAKERARIVRAAAKYAPQEAKEAMQADQQNLADIIEPQRVPSRPALFALAYSSEDTIEGDLESAYGIYAELYVSRYGTEEGMYEEKLADADIQEQEALEGASAKPVEILATDTLEAPPSPDPLYQVAENRIRLKARQEGIEATEADIETEYQRLISLRQL